MAKPSPGPLLEPGNTYLQILQLLGVVVSHAVTANTTKWQPRDAPSHILGPVLAPSVPSV